MDIPSMTIGMTVLACVITLFLLIQRNGSSISKELVEALNEAAQEYQIDLLEKDIWRSKYAIGLDPMKKGLIFLDKMKNETNPLFLNLQTIKYCSIKEISEKRKIKNGYIKNTSYIGLEFTFKDKANPRIMLPFYDETHFVEVSNELALAGKWHRRVKGILSNELALHSD